MSGQQQLSEADFQRRVIDAAKMFGWRIVHIRAAQIRQGRWAVPYEGDAGLQDLILAKNGTVILAELKSDSGKLALSQHAWARAAGSHGRVWRPADWHKILRELSGITDEKPGSRDD